MRACVVTLLAMSACGSRSELDEASGACAAETVAVSAAISDLAVDERDVSYWATSDGIFRHDAKATTVLTLADATAIAVDASRIFFTVRTTGQLAAVPRDGGDAVTLADGFVNPSAIAVQGASVIVLDETQGGRVSRVDSSGVVNTLAAVPYAISSAFAVDDVAAYVAVGTSADASVLRIDTHSGQTTTVFSSPSLEASIALGDTTVYGMQIGTSWVSIVDATKSSNDAWPTTLFTPTTANTFAFLVADADGLFMTTSTAPLGSARGELWHVALDGSNGAKLVTSETNAFLELRTSSIAIHWVAVDASQSWSVRRICK